MRYTTINKFRKAHRFLGIFIGIQFLFWTISGLYFSWTDIDKIHGDHYKKTVDDEKIYLQLLNDSLLKKLPFPLHSIKVKLIGEERFFWVNDSVLVDPNSGVTLPEISEHKPLKLCKNTFFLPINPLVPNVSQQ